MTPGEARAAERILIVAPTGRDGEMIRDRLAGAGLTGVTCDGLPELLGAIDQGAGAAVIAQEALTPAGVGRLVEALDAQEAWSDLPVLVLLGTRGKGPQRLPTRIFERSNVTLLQRPLGVRMLVSAVRSALRARRRQFEMRDLYRDLEHAVQLSELFVSILGHDLRTPIAAIRLSAQSLQRLDPDPRALRSTERILTSADRMARMIEQLLDLARVRQGQGLQLRPTRVDLGELCQQVVQEVVQASPDAGLDVRLRGDTRGRWDPDRLSQVISNLATNAVQHGARGRPVTVEVDGAEENAVHLRVHNFGALDPEKRSTLFQPFRPSDDTSKPRRGGLGLGLFIVREIARAHGGDVDVRTPDETTVFEVTLPRWTEG